MAVYTVTFVLEDGQHHVRNYQHAPPPSYLRHPKGRFAMRYFPSKKAWRVYDLHRTKVYRGFPVPTMIYQTPSEEAALMFMTLQV